MTPNLTAPDGKKYDPCGGCGADHPSKACIGCHHPFARLNGHGEEPAQPSETPRASDRPLWSVLRERIDAVIRDHTSFTYDCGRVWSAWNVGTMSEDDFTHFHSGDRIENLVYDLEEIYEPEILKLNKELAARDALIEELRSIFPDICEALGNGSFCTGENSIEFLREIPKEVALVIKGKDALIGELREALSKLVDPDACYVGNELRLTFDDHVTAIRVMASARAALRRADGKEERERQ